MPRRSAKKGPPAHQNKFAFKHNPGSKLTKKILAAPIVGLCRRCSEIVEWRKKYRKYKPLTAPGKCSKCLERKITLAYHNLCRDCATKLDVCAKCQQPKDIVKPDLADTRDQDQIERDFQAKLAALSERERRTFLRLYERGEIDRDGNPIEGADGEGDDDDDDDADEEEEEEAEDDLDLDDGVGDDLMDDDDADADDA